MRRIPVICALAASLAFAACGDDEAASPTPVAESDASEVSAAPTAGEEKAKPASDKPKPKPGTRLEVGESQFGSIVFDADRAAIYIFDKESQGKSECYGACADAWPPVLTKGDPVAGKGIDAKGLGTTKRDDGSTQITYRGQPLYYYAHDPAGQVLCHNVFEFDGLWLVINPDGSAVA